MSAGNRSCLFVDGKMVNQPVFHLAKRRELWLAGVKVASGSPSPLKWRTSSLTIKMNGKRGVLQSNVKIGREPSRQL